MISPSSRDFNHIIDSVNPAEKAIEAGPAENFV